MSQTKAQLLAPIGIITCPGLDVTVGGSSPFQVGSTGIITAVSASFSGNVTVGGTLTYDDVTNIDSVGLVTARSGVDITGASAGVNGSSNLILKTGGNEKVRITSAGLVGVGTDNPASELHVMQSKSGGSSHGSSQLTLERDGTNYLQFLTANNGTSGILFGDVADNDGSKIKYDHNLPAMTFETEGAERLRIGSSGEIGISGANYGTSGQILTSQGNSAAPQWTTPAAGGLTEYDQWTVDVNTNSGSYSNGWEDNEPWGGSTTPVTVRLSSTSTTQNPLFAKIGTGVSKDSNGYFSFPSTGYWEVKFTAILQAQYGLRTTIATIRATTNNGGAWSKIASSPARSTNSSHQIGNIQPITVLLNITDTTNQKIYFACEIEDEGIVRGEPDQIMTNMIFKKVG